MKRVEALALVGQPVRAWTAANGVYAGVLRAVHGSPWRGKVLITGVLEVAQHLERGQACRRGLRPGDEIDVGGAYIRALEAGEASCTTYMDALVAEAASWSAGVVNGQNAWLPPALVESLQKVIDAEKRRLAGEDWRIA